MKALILGGVKSGKSRYALQLADDHAAKLGGLASDVAAGTVASQSSADASLFFIATARADDDEMHRRIERHKADRPDHWNVIEEPRYLTEKLAELESEFESSGVVRNAVVIVDCLTLWLTQLCCEDMSDDALDLECQRLTDVVSKVSFTVIIVSNELNMGVTPLGEFSRRYCDAAGLLHQRLATVSDTVTLVVAGLPLPLKPQ